MAAAIWRKAKNCFLTLTTLLVFIGGLGEISIACELSVGAKICYQKVRFHHYIQLRSDDQMQGSGALPNGVSRHTSVKIQISLRV